MTPATASARAVCGSSLPSYNRQLAGPGQAVCRLASGQIQGQQTGRRASGKIGTRITARPVGHQPCMGRQQNQIMFPSRLRHGGIEPTLMGLKAIGDFLAQGGIVEGTPGHARLGLGMRHALPSGSNLERSPIRG